MNYLHTYAKLNASFSRLVFRFLPAILFVCYGVSMGLLFYQWNLVGAGPSVIRFIAWQGVLLLALQDRSHLESREQVEALHKEIDQALNTTGIRRVEFNELKRDLERVRDYLARTDRTKIDSETILPRS